MPHKHTRKRGDLDKSTIDLPPSIIAQPLPVSKSAAANGIFTTTLSNPRREKQKKRKRTNDQADDTPKAFARLMAFQAGKKLPSGLDNGTSTQASKKRKRAGAKKEEGSVPIAEEKIQAQEVPTIRPGERMSDFAARVDAALPVSGLINKTARGGKDPLGLKVARTKTEKRMHRMYDEWREEERKIKEKREEAQDLADMEEMDVEDGQVKWKVEIETGSRKKGKGKGKKTKVRGEVDDGEEDPWEQIKRNRAEAKAGLNDVVQAPPTFSQVPRERFKALEGAKVNVGDVPRASGSLRRREELGEVRRSIVEGYRAMMKKAGSA